MTEFISQFVSYPDVTHDDVLDMAAMSMLKFPAFGVGVPKVNLPVAAEGSSGWSSGSSTSDRHRPIVRLGAP